VFTAEDSDLLDSGARTRSCEKLLFVFIESICEAATAIVK
jgi:hypothetical protein